MSNATTRQVSDTERSLIDFLHWLRMGQEIYASDDDTVTNLDVIEEYNREAKRIPSRYRALDMDEGLKFLPWIMDGEVIEWDEYRGRARVRFDEYERTLAETLVCLQYPKDMADAQAHR